MRARVRNLSLGALAGVALVALIGAGGFPSRPTFQQTTVRSTTPSLFFDETDASATNQRWRWRAASEGLVLQTCNDGSDTCTGDAISLERTGATIDSIALAAGAVTLNGVAASDFARLSQSNVLTSPGQSTAAVFLSSTNPVTRWQQSNASANNKNWDFYAFGEALVGEAVNDANDASSPWVRIERTGIVIDSINLTATAVQANGVAVGTIRSCTTACDVAGITVGQSAIVTKVADTSRASTATETADPDLQFLNVPTGFYRLDFYLDWNNGAGGTRWQWTDASSTLISMGMLACDTTFSVLRVDAVNDATCASTTNTEYSGIARTTRGTTPGTISIDWAQSTSNAANTTLANESWLMLTRLD